MEDLVQYIIEIDKKLDEVNTVIKFDSIFKFDSVDEDSRITFVNGYGTKLIIEGTHFPQCCEYNYMDTTNISDSLISEMEFDTLFIESIDDYGFRLNTHGVPCYSSQNGYYSTLLTLSIYLQNTKGRVYSLTEIDLGCELLD